jgi:hypothetical protein
MTARDDYPILAGGVSETQASIEARVDPVDVTDLQRQQIETHSACVVEGICVISYEEGSGMTWWGAPLPWLYATRPCETCRGLGCTCPGYCERADDHVCPDCRDGHPIVELRALCPMCEGDADDRWPCPPGCVNGRVSLGRYTVELIAVIKDTWLNGMFDPPPVPGRDRVAVLTKVDHDLQR